MVTMRADRVRGLISIVLLILLCIGILIYCLIAVVDHDKKSSESPADGLKRNTSESEGQRSQAHEDVENTTELEDEVATHLLTHLGEEYKIKLNRRDNASSGIVYIVQDDREGFVCTDGFDSADARVVCRELGFKHGLPYNSRHHLEHYPYTRYTLDEPILSGLNCTGNEKRISECDGFRLDNDTTCTWFTGVVCYNEDEPYELRLVNEIFPNAGMVEMKLGGEWGIFCAIHTFDDELADILCRNMNYTGGLTIPRGELGPVTSSKIWAPFVHCTTSIEIKQTVFECSLTLHTENVLYDHVEFRNNRYLHQYMACTDNPSFAASVQCLK